jgi:hypothetical protein
LTSNRFLYHPFRTLRALLEVDGPADATGVVGECTGAGALWWQGWEDANATWDLWADYTLR